MADYTCFYKKNYFGESKRRCFPKPDNWVNKKTTKKKNATAILKQEGIEIRHGEHILYVVSSTIANEYTGRIKKIKIHGIGGVTDDFRNDPQTYDLATRNKLKRQYAHKIQEVTEALEERKSLVIFCNHGRTRSVIVAIKWLQSEGLSWSAAKKVVQDGNVNDKVRINWEKIDWFKDFV